MSNEFEILINAIAGDDEEKLDSLRHMLSTVRMLQLTTDTTLEEMNISLQLAFTDMYREYESGKAREVLNQLENVQNQAAVAVSEAVTTPEIQVRKHYPIRIDANLIQSWIVWSDQCKASLTEWINQFFDAPHDEDLTLNLLWSKAQ